MAAITQTTLYFDFMPLLKTKMWPEVWVNLHNIHKTICGELSQLEQNFHVFITSDEERSVNFYVKGSHFSLLQHSGPEKNQKLYLSKPFVTGEL